MNYEFKHFQVVCCFSLQKYINICIYFRTVIGLRGKDGIVFAVEKLVTSKLYEPGANKRIFSIDKNIGMVSMNKKASFWSLVLFQAHNGICRAITYCKGNSHRQTSADFQHAISRNSPQGPT
jgi:hypothetical protein